MNEALKAIFDGQDFSDEFLGKIQEAFDNAVSEAVDKEVEAIEESTEAKYEQLSKDYAEYVVEECEGHVTAYVEKEVMPMVEKYLDYSVSQFMTENKVGVESTVKVELAESFLSGMSGLAESFNVKVPEGHDDYVMQMEQKAADIQKRFDAVLDEKNELEAQIVEGKREAIITDQFKSLTESQKEKAGTVAERVKFESEEQFTQAMGELVESYFPVSGKESLTETEEHTEEETVNESESKPKSWADDLFSKL